MKPIALVFVMSMVVPAYADQLPGMNGRGRYNTHIEVVRDKDPMTDKDRSRVHVDNQNSPGSLMFSCHGAEFRVMFGLSPREYIPPDARVNGNLVPMQIRFSSEPAIKELWETTGETVHVDGKKAVVFTRMVLKHSTVMLRAYVGVYTFNLEEILPPSMGGVTFRDALQQLPCASHVRAQ
jgi:hypothetical protein